MRIVFKDKSEETISAEDYEIGDVFVQFTREDAEGNEEISSLISIEEIRGIYL